MRIKKPNRKLKEFIDITERNLKITSILDKEEVFVKDAKADPTVSHGWAKYRFEKSNNTFIKIAEQESLDKDSDSIKLANNLTTIGEGKGLDARQGRVLKRLIDNINEFDIESVAHGKTIDLSTDNQLEAPDLLTAFDSSVKFLEDFDYGIEKNETGSSFNLILRNARKKDIAVLTKKGVRYVTMTNVFYIGTQSFNRGEYIYMSIIGRFRDSVCGILSNGEGAMLGSKALNTGLMMTPKKTHAIDDGNHDLFMIRFLNPEQNHPIDTSKISIYPYWKRALATTKEMTEYASWYGVEWDSASSSPDCKRIGNIHHHQNSPIQSKLKRCLVWDNGTVHYYLDENNSKLKEDGTPSVLDGSHGQVMVEVPEFYYNHELVGTKHRYRISEHEITGYKRIKQFYISAYEASLQRSTNKLSSVMNVNPDYRGGNNTSAWDLEPKTLLGKPVTNLTRSEFRTAASNRGEKWHQQTAYEYYPLSMLFVIEYATFNSQKEVDYTLENGMKKGGLGLGATTLTGAQWNAFNSYNPLGKCGATNSKGNRSGEITHRKDSGGLSNENPIKFNSYRGIENPFGHIWKFMDGVNINNHTAYATDNMSSLADNTINGYERIGIMPSANGYQSDIQNHLLPIPKSVGGASTTHLSDYYYQNSGWRVALVGGALNNGSYAGLFSLSVYYSSSYRSAHIGARLCLRNE